MSPLLIGLGPVLDAIVRHHSSLFEQVARLPEDTPAHQASLQCHIDLSLGRLPDPSWRRCPGHPRNRWLDQLHRDNKFASDLVVFLRHCTLYKFSYLTVHLLLTSGDERHAWTLRGDATVLDDYTLATTTTMVRWHAWDRSTWRLLVQELRLTDMLRRGRARCPSCTNFFYLTQFYNLLTCYILRSVNMFNKRI